MITLPLLERSSLISFTIIIAALSGLMLGMFLWSLEISRPFGWATVFAMVLCLLQWFAPRLMRLPYRLWNRAAIEVARCASALVTIICFYITIAAVGRTGSALTLTPPELAESMWIPCPTDGARPYHYQQAVRLEESRPKHWISCFTLWALRTGNLWSCFLLPFLVLLSALDARRPETVPTDIYTLY
jgi:hypothetical protein